MPPTLPIRAAVTAIGLFVPGSEDRVRGFGDSLNYMRGDCVRGECFMFALAMHALAGVCIILLNYEDLDDVWGTGKRFQRGLPPPGRVTL